MRRGQIPPSATEEDVMKVWKRPRIREITCGMEINGYFPAEI
ncbi:pyrroloquinoline quinone precursor peptide PqqA [Marinibaculum pumilum]|uniref:Coenzyme PQQ synthesis protein A n=1 Tax=Marinibaculum pumilum TaxID=1766165 RepID=A0ABV7KVQ9_9PROT